MHSVVGKTAPIRPHDALRMQRIHEYCGCLPCLLSGFLDVLTTIEHVTDRGRRVGLEEQHQWTIGLCRWHHFGEMTATAIHGETGPSLAFGRKVFERHFGDEVHVLVPTQDFVLLKFEEEPWGAYNLPRHVARETRNHWTELRNATVT